MDDHTLYLAKEELQLFEKLPAKLKLKWQPHVKMETIDAYETEEEITRRLQDSRFEMPGLQETIKNLGSKKETMLDFSKVSDPAWAEYFYTIGACGTSALLQISLQAENVDEDQMESIAGMSRVRHTILEENLAKQS